MPGWQGPSPICDSLSRHPVHSHAAALPEPTGGSGGWYSPKLPREGAGTQTQGDGGPVRPPGPPTPPDGFQGPQDRQGMSEGHRATQRRQGA